MKKRARPGLALEQVGLLCFAIGMSQETSLSVSKPRLRLINPRSPLTTKAIQKMELRHAQMVAFHEFYSFASILRRLKLWPFKRSCMTNLAIHPGLTYYYSKKRRPLPYFNDYLKPASGERIMRSLGIKRSDNDGKFQPAV